MVALRRQVLRSRRLLFLRPSEVCIVVIVIRPGRVVSVSTHRCWCSCLGSESYSSWCRQRQHRSLASRIIPRPFEISPASKCKSRNSHLLSNQSSRQNSRRVTRSIEFEYIETFTIFDLYYVENDGGTQFRRNANKKWHVTNNDNTANGPEWPWLLFVCYCKLISSQYFLK